MKQFVYVTKDIPYKGKTINGTIKKDEIGIIKSKGETTSFVSFVCNNIFIELDNSLIEYFDPSRTGDQYAKKVCNVCNRLLDVDMFEKNQNGKDNRTVRRPSCRDCRDIIDGVDMSAEEKRQMDKIKPHMEIWTCPICKKTTVPGLTSKVVCDHNHKTGHPRAWICDSCNTGLGRFKDDINLLNSAIDYLKDNDQ